MNCSDATALFSEYYDGELDAETLAAVSGHLEICAGCSAEYEGYRGLFDEIHALPAPEPPEYFHRRLMTSLPKQRLKKFAIQKKQPAFNFKQLGWAGGAVAAGFIMLSLFVSGIAELVSSQSIPAPVPVLVRESSFSSMPAPLYEAAVVSDAEYELAGSPASASAPLLAPAPEMQIAAGRIASDAVTEAYNVQEDFSVIAAAPSEARMERAVNELAAGGTGGVATGYGAPVAMLAAGHYEQHFAIHINVADLAHTSDMINALAGYTLRSETSSRNFGGYAQFYRRVGVRDYEFVQNSLRALGTVTYETENVIKRADEVSDLEARLLAKDEESIRLKALLAQSHTLDVLIAVERQLGWVETERDSLRGRLNHIHGVCAQPYISIFLTENPPEPSVLSEERFSERVSERFIGSLNALIRFMENALVFLSGALVPLLVVAVAAGPAAIIVTRRRHAKKNDKKNETDEGRHE
jgi:anti-sigma factor RsiW